MQRSSPAESEESGWNRVRAEIRSASLAFADQLRLIDSGQTGHSGSTRLPNLDWDVRELAAHVVSLPEFYRSLNEAEQPFAMPDDFTEFSRSVRSHLADHSLEELTDQLGSETESLLEMLGDDGGMAWKLYLPTTAAKVGAGYLGELLLHGRDLAALTGATVAVEPHHAHPWIAASMTLAPFFVDPEVARKYSGVYHLNFRGGADYTMRLQDGLLTTETGRPLRPDGHMSADPVAYMLVSMGRMSELKAALTGKMVVYGRRPWKFLGLAKIKVEGV